jgi:predicted lipoprotein with Yx(FWY)xxD motif
MKHLRLFLAPIVFVIVLTLAACGSSSSTTSTTTSGNSAGNANNSGTPSASAAGTTVHTASATVSGKTVMLLTNAQGRTLYYFKADTPTTTACSGGCASTWPPYLSSGAGAPTSVDTLTGKLAVQTTTNGQQITYNGHLLYTYAGDSAPGQTNGEGIGNKWFVATNDLAASTTQQNTTPSSSKSGSYGY